jgi:hypothetical protein
LPASAFIELAGLTVFALNLAGTFFLEAPHVCKEPILAQIGQRTS